LPPDQPEHAYSPSWSPDGETVVFSGDGGLYLASETTSPKAIPNTNFLFGTPDWSPKGGPILFTARNHDHWDIGTINPDGSGLVFLTSGGSMGGVPVSSAAAAWSPSGDQIVFTSDRAGTWNLYTMNSDGSGVALVGTAAVSYTGSSDRVVSWKK
jgi:TolB protein